MQQVNNAGRSERRSGNRMRRSSVMTGVALGALVVVIALAASYLLRRSLYQGAITLFQPWISAYSRAGLDAYLGEHAAAISAATQHGSGAASGPLRRSSTNPRYFVDASGQPVYLTGSHTWSNLQDNGNGSPPPVFDYNKYLDFLTANNHNFFRLWVWEQSRWTVETRDDNYWFYPETPYVRTGPGTALDGKPKFDLDQFNQAYFDRMRERVIAARDRGIYVSIMLFDGWSISKFKFNQGRNPWPGHPFNAANNVNGVNGDRNGDDSGEEVHTLADPAILAYQQAYVRKVIDTVNDLDNVLYEISNESYVSATQWQYAMIDFIKQYESGKPKQHPVGMTAQTWPEGTEADLLASNADWISPSGVVYKTDPPANSTDKVIIADTDHLWGIGGDHVFVWKSFTRGLNPIFMDCYDGAGYGVGGVGCNFNAPDWVKLRANMGYTNEYARRMNLVAMTPREDLCSTLYCLANPSATGAEYLVYNPPGGSSSFTVNLKPVDGSMAVEWLNPATGEKIAAPAVQGGAVRSFTPPFSGDAVLYLASTTGLSPTPTPTPTPRPTKPTPRPTPTTPPPPTSTPPISPTTQLYLPSIK